MAMLIEELGRYLMDIFRFAGCHSDEPILLDGLVLMSPTPAVGTTQIVGAS